MKRVMILGVALCALVAGCDQSVSTSSVSTPTTNPTSDPLDLQASQPTTHPDEAVLVELHKAIAVASSKAESARGKALSILKASNKYKEAALSLAALEARVKQARASQSDLLPDISAKWIKAKGIVATLERESLNNDAEFVASESELRQVLVDASKAERFVADRKQQEAETAQAVQRNKAVNANEELKIRAAEMAWGLAKYSIPRFLKDPSSADIQWRDVGVQTKTPGQQWVVAGIVRGKNGFGAIVADTWSMKVTRSSRGELEPSELKLNDDVVMR